MGTVQTPRAFEIVAGTDRHGLPGSDDRANGGYHTDAGTGGAGPPGNVPTGSDRKFAAKRFNEHVKALWGIANGLALALIVAAVVTAYIGKDAPQEMDADRIQWACIGVLLHVVGHVIIALFMQKED